MLEISTPFITLVNYSVHTVSDVWSKYLFLVKVEEENKRLKHENERLASEVVKYREGYLEAVRLRKILGLQQTSPFSSLAARVISRSHGWIHKTILIDKGIVDGIKVGLPVVSTQGVVGRVIETAWHVSRVLLLTDESSSIDALIQDVRVHGILQGSSSGECVLKYIAKTETIKPGDIVLTSGLSGVFPKGLVLGVVREVDKANSGLFQRIVVVPAVDLTKLEEVVILSVREDRKR